MSTKNKCIRPCSNKALKCMFIFFGMGFLALGTIGIFLPLLPTTPFLLLASACFLKSSERLYNWLITNKVFGKYLKNYMENRGIPLKVKILAISFLWFTILTSSYFIIKNYIIEIFLIIIALVVTIHIFLIKTYKT